MKTIVAVIAVGAAAAAAAAVMVVSGPQERSQQDSPLTSFDFDPSADDRERIRALEQAVSEERAARQLLEDELFALIDEVEQLRSDAAGQAQTEPLVAGSGGAGGMRVFQGAQVGVSTPEAARDQRRREALVKAGFDSEEAERILRRESELRMEVMQARFEARMNGEAFDPYNSELNPAQRLAEELGEERYERYLEANNRSTSIAINSVLESSPAQAAGLLPGDRIVRYGGERVYSVGDLTRQTMQGDPGENVVVDVMRDGAPMQVVLPRGPLGIMGGRGR